MKEKFSSKRSVRLFFKAMLYTACAIALVVIGYFTASFFFGG